MAAALALLLDSLVLLVSGTVGLIGLVTKKKDDNNELTTHGKRMLVLMTIALVLGVVSKGGQFWQGVATNEKHAQETLRAATTAEDAARDNDKEASLIMQQFSALRNSWTDPWIGLQLTIDPVKDLTAHDRSALKGVVKSISNKQERDLYEGGFAEALRTTSPATLSADSFDIGRQFSSLRVVRFAVLRHPQDFSDRVTFYHSETTPDKGYQEKVNQGAASSSSLLYTFAQAGNMVVNIPARLGAAEFELERDPVNPSIVSHLVLKARPTKASVIRGDQHFTSLDELKGSQILLTLQSDPSWSLEKQYMTFINSHFSVIWRLEDGRSCQVDLKPYFPILPGAEAYGKSVEIYFYGTIPDDPAF